MWERDLKYKLLVVNKGDESIEAIFDYRNKDSIYGKGEICSKYNEYLKLNSGKREELPKNVRLKEGGNYVRNYIAHFNYIPSPEYSLLEVFKKMRELLDYDRKLKNSYLKSMMKIFEEYGFKVTFKIDSYKNITLESIKSEKTIHLKKGNKKEIKIDRYSKKMCQLVESLVIYRKYKLIKRKCMV